MASLLWDNVFRRRNQEQELLDVLKETFLFGTLSQRELRFLLKMLHVRHYQPNEVIFRPGEMGVGMYVIFEGEVDVLHDLSSVSEMNGDLPLITRLAKGDFFGEIALVQEEERRTVLARAHCETQLLGFFKPDLLEIMDRNPSLGVKIVFRLAEALGKRVRMMNQQVEQLKRELQRERRLMMSKEKPDAQFD